MTPARSSDHSEAPPWVTYTICLGLVVIAIALVAYSVVLIRTRYPTTNTQEAWQIAGTQGDFTGGHIAAGASLAGTFLFLAALLLQSADLRNQRKQFLMEMAAQRQAAKDAMALAAIVQLLGARGSAAVDAMAAANPREAPGVADVHIRRQAEVLESLLSVLSDEDLKSTIMRAALVNADENHGKS